MLARPGFVVALLVGLLLAACTAPSAPLPSRPATTAPATPTPPTQTPTSSSGLPAGPSVPFRDAGAEGRSVTEGDDWTLPSWVRPAANSGFFSEDESLPDHIAVRSIDLAWRQLRPTADGPLDRTASGRAQGLHFDGLDEQLARPGDFWMRVFASGEDWAPAWVAARCGVRSYGPDYDGQRHLPLWNECVWQELLATYRSLFVDSGLAADPRLRFVYVPGAFTWAEYDYEMITAAVEAGDVLLDGGDLPAASGQPQCIRALAGAEVEGAAGAQLPARRGHELVGGGLPGHRGCGVAFGPTRRIRHCLTSGGEARGNRWTARPPQHARP